MPQLDTATLFSQYLWMLILFTLFYSVINKIILPQISKLLKVRKNLTILCRFNPSVIFRIYFSFRI